MTVTAEREALAQRARSLIERLADGSRDDEARDALLHDLLVFQARNVEPYTRLVATRGHMIVPSTPASTLPAVPTDVFRFVRVASHPAEEDVRVFRTSGTSAEPRGVHAFADLSSYDAAARAAARHALFPDVERIRIVCLVPSPAQAPDSSLAYMLGRFEEWFADGAVSFAWSDGVDAATLVGALDTAISDGAPIAVLGTSFAFVDAEALLDRRFSLPPGSRVMQTGGFKGRSRELSPPEMRAILRDRYGVPETHVVAEYGMTELSSQMYETTLRAPSEPRRLWVPGWVRAVPVDPESLRPVSSGEIGILRIEDVANIGSVAAIQTSDLARVVGDGVEVLGRAPGAVPRGCSLLVDDALARRGGSR